MKAILVSWTRFGLRGRLFLAFGVVAGLTVLASGNAIVSYDRIGHALFVVTERSMPDIARTTKVVKAAADVTAAAPSLLAASDQAGRDAATKALADRARGSDPQHRRAQRRRCGKARQRPAIASSKISAASPMR